MVEYSAACLQHFNREPFRTVDRSISIQDKSEQPSDTHYLCSYGKHDEEGVYNKYGGVVMGAIASVCAARSPPKNPFSDDELNPQTSRCLVTRHTQADHSHVIAQQRLACFSKIMVLYFTSNVVTPAAFIYVGKDKVESQHRLEMCSMDDTC